MRICRCRTCLLNEDGGNLLASFPNPVERRVFVVKFNESQFAQRTSSDNRGSQLNVRVNQEYQVWIHAHIHEIYTLLYG